MSSKEKLAAALREVGLEHMALEAEDGYYDDFESPLAMPINQLVLNLRARGKRYYALAQRAIEGEFDGTPEESAAWFEREGKDLLK
jgi:hypothetical protein